LKRRLISAAGEAQRMFCDFYQETLKLNLKIKEKEKQGK